eukprot:CAMPEP_0116106344 /NCGR_PEP_ID=MMETSP0327-20121206/15585_1 /TAXON_ID=44447 /ORGANISM="Pseudo-nitzschia delicatissima, Strain B596" /LENGTH=850 /DNA_ID=CAMNT_0003598949 /DNA_START=129 /DNA_END=2681 /DNA_ORIENTATION=-
MAHQPKIGLTILAVASMHSAANAFVPLANHAKTAVSTFDRKRSLATRREYSNNNVDDNNNKDSFVAPGPIDPKSSSSSDAIEFLFDEESFLNDVQPSPMDFNLESPLLNESQTIDASAIMAENAAILYSGGGDTIDLGFDLNLESPTNPATVPDVSEDAIEGLKAVLAASEEAAAAAEASMPQELVDHLDELSVVALNATNLITTSDDEVDVPPKPEVVPTIATITVPQQEQQSSQTSNADEVSLSHVVFDADLSESSKTVKEKTLVEQTPSVRKILKFAIPAIGVWLCGPILSLIDTSAVGVLSGTVQQAALNPAVAVTDYAALLIAFLYTGTTNMVASAQQTDRGTKDMPRTAKMMIGAMRMSTYVGAGLGAFLFVFARPLLRGIIGNDAISPAVFAAAMKYVRIRALGMPAAAVLGSTQAACLGMQDIKSPLYVLAAAAVINFLGDMLFVGHSNPLIGGTAGAAWATVLSQYTAVAFFIRWLSNKATKTTTEKQPGVMNLSDAIMEMTGKSDKTDCNGKNRRQSFRNVMDTFKGKALDVKRKRSTLFQNKGVVQNIRESRFGKAIRRRNENVSKVEDSDDSFSTRGFLKNRFTTSDLFKLPDAETREKFAPYVLPVTSTQVGRVSGYVAMAHVVASSLGTVSMAAQQVIVSIFYCLCPIADSLSLTAQSFVPAIAEKESSMEKSAAMKKMLVNFLKAGGIFGGAMMAAVCGIPMMTGFFTPDQAVKELVNSVVPLLLVFFSVHGFVCGTEGMLLGQKDLGFLGKMYAAFFAAVPYIMLGVKRKALAGCTSVGLSSVWTVFIGYQLARCGLWLGRAAKLQRGTYMAAKEQESAGAASATTNMSTLLAP